MCMPFDAPKAGVIIKRGKTLRIGIGTDKENTEWLFFAFVDNVESVCNDKQRYASIFRSVERERQENSKSN